MLACLALLAAVIVPNFIKVKPRGVSTACKSNLKNIATALEMFSTDNKGAYPPQLAGLTPNYLKLIPNCPGAGFDTYSSSFESHTAPLEKLKIECPGHHAENAECRANLARLNDSGKLDPKIRCPLAGEYLLRESEGAFTVMCKGLNHEGASMPADHPRYTSSQGLIER
ncbi:hypothetical protein DYH09_21285 [bacterium CPR1]|nr:hypothetical protein [bacterium CPR1]